MSTSLRRARPALALWIALAFTAGVVGAAAGSEPDEEAIAVGAGIDTGAPSTTTLRLRTTTTAAPTTTAVPETTTTAAPAETTLPPAPEPPTTLPPAPEPVPAETTVPAVVRQPTDLEIWFGPEVYAENGQPFIHVRGTSCTGPDHTQGGTDFIWNYPLQPGQYGVSYVYADPAGEWLIRMDPMAAQPGTGDWEVAIPPIGGAGDFVVFASCVDSGSTVQPIGSPSSWAGAVLEYPPHPFTMPG